MTDIRTAPDSTIFRNAAAPLADWDDTECTITAEEWADLELVDAWDDLLVATLCEA